MTRRMKSTQSGWSAVSLRDRLEALGAISRSANLRWARTWSAAGSVMRSLDSAALAQSAPTSGPIDAHRICSSPCAACAGGCARLGWATGRPISEAVFPRDSTLRRWNARCRAAGITLQGLKERNL